MSRSRHEHGVILAARSRDGELAQAILDEIGIVSVTVATLEDFVAAVRSGSGFGILAEEAMRNADHAALFKVLAEQPAWSDFPIILITHRGSGDKVDDAERQFRSLGNVTFLERPFHPSTLISLARAAVRARGRQYDTRELISEIDESRARLGAALDAAQLGVHEYNPQAGTILWDRFVRRIWGVRDDQAVTYDVFFDGIHPEDRPKVEAALDAAFDPRTGGTYRCEFRVVHRQHATETWVDVDGTVTFQDGTPVRLVGTVRDVTARRRSDDAVRRAERELRALSDAMPQLVWRSDARGRIDYYNARRKDYRRLASGPDGELDWRMFVHPDDRAATKARWAQALATRETYVCEHRLGTALGAWRWHMSRAEPEFDQTGTLVRWYGTATDIEDLKQAQAQLQRINETLAGRVDDALAEKKIFADIMESTDALVQVSDLTFNWLAINRASADQFEAIFGVRPRVGDNMLDVLAGHPAQRDAMRAVWSRALAGEEFTVTTVLGAPGLAQRHYEMKFNVLRGADGRQIGAFQFGRDVTQQIEDHNRLADAETRLRQAQKMEAVGQLTGGIAHDFNNLLMVIASGLRVMEQRSDATSQIFVRDAMNQAVERGTTLTRQLLAFSRKRPLEMRVLGLHAQLHAMQVLLDRAIGGGMTIEIDVPEEVWPISTDAAELELAVLNLCLNARDAQSQGGTIGIVAKNAAAGCGSVTGEAVTLTVVDNGRGIPPTILARVFEPFFTTKEVGKGSGLGLAQVYAFAKQSGGEVLIDSVVGQGTAVTLVFPRAREPVAESATPRPPSAAVVPKETLGRVLLVEDDQSVAGLTIALLDIIGYVVEHVASAAAALARLAEEHSFRAILSDVMMPGGMSGADLAREVSRRHPDLPVVLTTGSIELGRDLVAQGFRVLHKPYQLAELEAALSAAVDQGDTQRAARERCEP